MYRFPVAAIGVMAIGDRWAASLVVGVVCGENEPGVAGVLVLRFRHRRRPFSGDRVVPRCVAPIPAASNRRTSPVMLSALDPMVNRTRAIDWKWPPRRWDGRWLWARSGP